MIEAIIFDLDGTLVQTERLKAISYGRAAVELRPDDLTVEEVVEGFREVVGLSRREVATSLLERFNLEEATIARMEQPGVEEPWEAYVQVRLDIYEQMLADPQVLLDNQWPHNMALLKRAQSLESKVALATMSRREQAMRVLDILDIKDAFDFVATRDDVENGKPDPEIYLLVAKALDVPPHECMVIEDSPTGVKAALNAGMEVVAVSTPFTGRGLHASGLLPAEHIVDRPDELPDVLAHIVAHHEEKHH